MDMMFATVCAFFLGEKVLVPNRFCVRVAGFPECLMMMQIRLPLLNGLLASCGLLADLLCCFPC